MIHTVRIVAPTDSAIAPAMSLGVVCTVGGDELILSWINEVPA